MENKIITTKNPGMMQYVCDETYRLSVEIGMLNPNISNEELIVEKAKAIMIDTLSDAIQMLHRAPEGYLPQTIKCRRKYTITSKEIKS